MNLGQGFRFRLGIDGPVLEHVLVDFVLVQHEFVAKLCPAPQLSADDVWRENERRSRKER